MQPCNLCNGGLISGSKELFGKWTRQEDEFECIERGFLKSR